MAATVAAPGRSFDGEGGGAHRCQTRARRPFRYGQEVRSTRIAAPVGNGVEDEVRCDTSQQSESRSLLQCRGR